MDKVKPVLLKDAVGVSDLAIVMGDPDRVYLLSTLLEKPEIIYDRRGIVAVNGEYKGRKVTLASHGIGCSMASIILEELGMLGAKTIIRIGTAGSLVEDLDVGDTVLAAGAGYMLNGCGNNMYSPEINGGTSPDPLLLSGIYYYLLNNNVKPHVGLVFTSDAFYAEENIMDKLISRGFIAIDMETAILYMLGWIRKWRTLSILVISNSLVKKTPLLTTHELAERFIELTKLVLEYLAKYLELNTVFTNT
ncbi:purine-nucleoside phosphorylase [Staphylothermus hellenicus]|uniref:Purine or other phosphorylase family 1 n=1 Tax=Staphylothermus hellenicus (strain DSM 12710 / JCM 10830 / BK20S6-10-b1 / P8) TaxID=591019 RepID=D7DAP8_STAHD|nr:purine-nucleoside phosphorylase [Staphylothermus hellenicus]ADI31245.1 purine or other phosphorylase family 1 [Staphylothermus hellenicus DSM 12710]